MTSELDKIDWGRALKKLTAFALRRLGRGGRPADAEELAQEAVRQILDPAYKDWNPQVEPDLMRHLGSVVNGLIQDRRRKRTEELLVDAPDPPADLDVADGGQSAEHLVMASEIVDRVAARLSDDDVANRVFFLMVEDIFEPREQAKRLNVPVKTIYNARRRLDTHFEAVRNELELEEVGDAVQE